MIKKLNVFFFGEEKIHELDAVWFYGYIATVTAITMITGIGVTLG